MKIKDKAENHFLSSREGKKGRITCARISNYRQSKAVKVSGGALRPIRKVGERAEGGQEKEQPAIGRRRWKKKGDTRRSQQHE